MKLKPTFKHNKKRTIKIIRLSKKLGRCKK